jgi:LPXTG-site transpeptidase (sortase) family protein
MILVPLLAAADAPLTQRTTLEGSYGLVTGGVGLTGGSSGDIQLNVPGTPVEAILYWAGHDLDQGGDNTIDLSVNGAASVTITADRTYGPDYWFGTSPQFFHYVYAADVTSMILSGASTYTVSGFGPITLEYGAGLDVVYEDANLPTTFVEIVEGLDSAFHGFPAPRGPNSEVSCVQFASSVSARDMEIALFVGGIDVSSELRPNAFWYQTGTGSLPTNIVDQPEATEIGGQPFNSRDGEEWDTYTNTIPVLAGDTYACFQIESVSDEPGLNGASFLWLALGVTLPLDIPTPTNTPPPSATETLSPTNTPLPTNTPGATDTPVPSNTPTSTATDPPPTPTIPPPSSTTSPTQDVLIPVTGFSPGEWTSLPDQPANLEYTNYPQFHLDIPEIGVTLPIVGIPQTAGGWDVTWLWDQAGYLEGTAFPTWTGNSVITSHVFLSNGMPGPFAKLDELQWGDHVTIDAYGQTYTYEVRRIRYVTPNDLSVLEHEDLDWVTLITCQGYDPAFDLYRFRLAVQAVLVSIE